MNRLQQKDGIKYGNIEFLALNTSLHVYLYGTKRSKEYSDRGIVSLEEM